MSSALPASPSSWNALSLAFSVQMGWRWQLQTEFHLCGGQWHMDPVFHRFLIIKLKTPKEQEKCGVTGDWVPQLGESADAKEFDGSSTDQRTCAWCCNIGYPERAAPSAGASRVSSVPTVPRKMLSLPFLNAPGRFWSVTGWEENTPVRIPWRHCSAFLRVSTPDHTWTCMSRLPGTLSTGPLQLSWTWACTAVHLGFFC